MKEYGVHFIGKDICLAAREGQYLSEVMTAAGVRLDMPCGGHGLCGKCLVRVRGAGEAEWRTVRACRETVCTDLEVELPEENDALRVLIDGDPSAGARDPFVRAVTVRVAPCEKGRSSSDWDRLIQALREALPDAGGKWRCEPALASELGDILRKTGGEVFAVCAGEHILELRDAADVVLMAAFDLGTTSIAGYLLDAATGATLASGGLTNPQTRFGADVIARADYALRKGTRELADCAREGIDSLLGRLCAQAGVARERVLAMSLAGNTCMHHLFLNMSPASLARAPYNPALSEALTLDAADYGLHGHPRARLYVLPVIAGFVGGDTVGCLVSGDWTKRRETALMIDIGTNGEMVMGNCEDMIACSTAAGPAFEGAKISCGMRGTDGAIDHARVEDGRLVWHVIGDGEAKGICGSGLLDITAALLKLGVIDESGRMEDGDYRIGDTAVTLTQKDVREIQLAKAAIAAGIRLLAKQLGIGLNEITTVEIAGAFGNHMDPASACAIGLIPPELSGRVRGIGNAAGAGAQRVLMDRSDMEAAARLAGSGGARFLELATLNEFQDVFVDELEFPETDE